MITVTGLRRAFGERVLFDDASMRVGARDRVALVGPNGSGKTTLFETIMRLQEPDGGRVDIAGGVVLGYLAQETDALRGRSILEEVMSAGAAMSQAGHRLKVLEGDIEQTTDEEERAALLHEYAALTERFDSLGGYSLETNAKQILAGLGFAEDVMQRQTDTLSGGWLMRIALAKLLLATPDALLLDEPTNHLDLESVVWLERFLRSYEGAVMVISHDRDFMNGIASKVVEIESSELWSYTGDYESFVEQRALRVAQAEAAAKGQARKRAHTQQFIDRFRYKASKAKQVQSRIKMLERMEAVPLAPGTQRSMRIGFPQPPRAGRIALTLRDVTFGYGDTPVYEELNAEVERGQKIVLVGPNGAGKTTLLKLFAGVLTSQHGERELGANVSLGYFAQHQIESLNLKHRVIEELQHAMPPGTTQKPRDLLGRFLFSGDDVDKPVGVLSGGERSRLALAKLLVQPHNVLCMDEPTNHLDIASRDVLEDALVEYTGTLVLITHDRHLIRSVANRVLEVIDGTVRVFPGDYEEYLERKAAEDAVAVPVQRAPDTAKERRRAGADERARANKARNAIRKVEQELERAHAAMTELGAVLADPSFYEAGDGVGDAVRAFADAEARVKKLESEWERLTEDAG